MILDGIRVSPLTVSACGTRYQFQGLFAYQRLAFLRSKMHTYSSILDSSASLLFSFRNLSNNIFDSRPLLCSLQIAETPNTAFVAAFCLFGKAATQRNENKYEQDNLRTLTFDERSLTLFYTILYCLM